MTPQLIKEAAKIIEALEEEVEKAAYHNKTGDHIQVEDDKIYFSIIGLSCNYQEYLEYKEWERTRHGLRSVISRIEPLFYNFSIKNLETHLVIEPKNT